MAPQSERARQRADEAADARAAARGVDNSAEAMAARMAQRDGVWYTMPKAVPTQKHHTRCIRLLRKFLTGLGENASAYLATRPNAKHLTVLQWQEYAHWLVSRSRGAVKRLVDETSSTDAPQTISLSTLLRNVAVTIAAKQELNRARHQLSLDDRECLWGYMQSELAAIFDMGKAMRVKLMPTQADLSAMLATCYTEPMRFHCCEQRLGFTLFVKLLIYCTCRPGEIACSPAYTEEPDGLRWGDIRLMHVALLDGRCTIAAIIRIRLLKGLRKDESAFKEHLLLLNKQTPLLCPLIDILGIAEAQGGVLKYSAADLLAVTDSRSITTPGTVTPITMHDSAKGNFVMRRIIIEQGDLVRSHNKLARYAAMVGFNELACMHAGIFRHATLYMWRRLGANMLNTSECTDDDRKLAMGHAFTSKIFGAYISRLARFDLQGAFDGAVDKSLHQEAFTRARTIAKRYKLPTCLSVAGRRAVFARADVREREKAAHDAVAAFYNAHTGISLSAGIQLGMQDAIAAREAKSDYGSIVAREIRRAFGAEIRANERMADEHLGDAVVEQLYQQTVEASCLDDASQERSNIDGATALRELGEIDLADIDAAQEAILQQAENSGSQAQDKPSKDDGYDDEADTEELFLELAIDDELAQDDELDNQRSWQQLIDGEEQQQDVGLSSPPPLQQLRKASANNCVPASQSASRSPLQQISPNSLQQQPQHSSTSSHRAGKIQVAGAKDARTFIAGENKLVHINAFGMDRCGHCATSNIEPCIVQVFNKPVGVKKRELICNSCSVRGNGGKSCRSCLAIVQHHWPKVADVETLRRCNDLAKPTSMAQSESVSSLDRLVDEADIQALPSVQVEQRTMQLTKIMSATDQQQLTSAKLLGLLLDDRLLLDAQPSWHGVRISNIQHPTGGCGYCGNEKLGRTQETHRRQCATKNAATIWLAGHPAQMQAFSDMQQCPVEHARRIRQGQSACSKVNWANATPEQKSAHLSAHLTRQSVLNGNAIYDARCMVGDCNWVCPTMLDMRVHLDEAHGLLVSAGGRMSKKQRESISVAMREAMECLYCKSHVVGPHTWRKHCVAHLVKLLNSDQQAIKYMPNTKGGDAISRPGFCIFCLHDNTLPPEKRAFMYGRVGDWAKHHQRHFKEWLGGDRAGESMGSEESDNEPSDDDESNDADEQSNVADEQSNVADEQLHSTTRRGSRLLQGTGTQICPVCCQHFGSLQEYGNHFVEQHELPIFGTKTRPKGEANLWNGRLDGLQQVAKIRKQRSTDADKQARGIKRQRTQYERKKQVQARFEGYEPAGTEHATGSGSHVGTSAEGSTQS